MTVSFLQEQDRGLIDAYLQRIDAYLERVLERASELCVYDSEYRCERERWLRDQGHIAALLSGGWTLQTLQTMPIDEVSEALADEFLWMVRGIVYACVCLMASGVGMSDVRVA